MFANPEEDIEAMDDRGGVGLGYALGGWRGLWTCEVGQETAGSGVEGMACCCLLSYMPTRILRRLPGTMPWRPWSEQSHQPSNPCVSRSKTVIMSPLRKESSSGDSATLSYNALAKMFWRKGKHKIKSTLDTAMGKSIVLKAGP